MTKERALAALHYIDGTLNALLETIPDKLQENINVLYTIITEGEKENGGTKNNSI